MAQQAKTLLPSSTSQAIGTQLDCLTDLLGGTVEALTEARGYLDQNLLNAAIGTISGLDERLMEVTALLQAMRILHRRR